MSPTPPNSLNNSAQINTQINTQSGIQIDFENSTDFTPLPTPESFKTWCRYVLEKLKKTGEIYIGLIDPDQMQEINHTYRHKKKPTNVLSFPFITPPDIQTNTLGDLLICPQIVFTEAQEQNKKLEHHFAHMVVHGTLHLLGYDHETDEEAHQMESLETSLLKHWDIPNPYDSPLGSDL